jgi:hypothetical protein
MTSSPPATRMPWSDDDERVLESLMNLLESADHSVRVFGLRLRCLVTIVSPISTA